jgi:phage protein U
MYAQLGSIVFEGFLGPVSKSTAIESNLAEHPLIDGKPRLQRVGDNLQEISLTLNLHISFSNPEGVINALEQARASATVMPFIQGNGAFLGTFVVKSIRTEDKKTNAFGDIVSTSVDVTLIEFADPNPAATRQSQARRDGIGNASNSPTPFAGPLANSSEAANLARTPIAVAGESQAVTSGFAAAQQQPAQEASKLADIARRLRKMRGELETLRTGIQNAQYQYQTAQRIINGATAALAAVGRVETLVQQGNLSGAIDANDELIRAADNLLGASSELATVSASRTN